MKICELNIKANPLIISACREDTDDMGIDTIATIEPSNNDVMLINVDGKLTAVAIRSTRALINGVLYASMVE